MHDRCAVNPARKSHLPVTWVEAPEQPEQCLHQSESVFNLISLDNVVAGPARPLCWVERNPA